MFIVFNTMTGYSDESMRFDNRYDAIEWMKAQEDPYMFRYRIEEV